MKLTRKPPFDPKIVLAKSDAGCTLVEYHKNQIVFSHGDLADALFYIREGTVKLTVVSHEGKEAVLPLLGAGDFFGEGCLAGQQVRMATASTISECSLMRLEKAVVIRMLPDEPAFSELFRSYLLARSIRMEEDLVDQLFNSSEKRLARVLLLLANLGNQGKPNPVIPWISQETLAEMIGATRSRVSFFMNRFRKRGFIDYNTRGLQVHNSLTNIVPHA